MWLVPQANLGTFLVLCTLPSWVTELRLGLVLLMRTMSFSVDSDSGDLTARFPLSFQAVNKVALSGVF